MASLPKNLRPSYTRSIRAYVRSRFLGKGVGLKRPIHSTTKAKIAIAHRGYSRMRTGSPFH